MIVFDEARTGMSQSLAVGGEVVLRLQENPTTGFRWQLSLSDSGRLELLEDRYDLGGAAPGAAGVRTVRYLARSKGTVSIQAVHKQAWESSEGARCTFTIVIT